MKAQRRKFGALQDLSKPFGSRLDFVWHGLFREESSQLFRFEISKKRNTKKKQPRVAQREKSVKDVGYEIKDEGFEMK